MWKVYHYEEIGSCTDRWDDIINFISVDRFHSLRYDNIRGALMWDTTEEEMANATRANDIDYEPITFGQ